MDETRPLQSTPPGEIATLRLVADYYTGTIDPRAFSARHPDYRQLSANPLVLETSPGSWVYLSRFGTVVYWNCTGPLIEVLDGDLQALPGVGMRAERTRDELLVEVGHGSDQVGWDEIRLRELRLDTLRIISLALAQSVALEHFELAVTEALTRFRPVVTGMKEKGKLVLTRHAALRTVGFAMDVRATVLDSLTLFDDPPETWESERLAHLDSALYDHFDLEERVSAINQKLAYLADASARVTDLLATRKAHRLEWTIILLIAFEIVMTLLRGR